MKCRLHALLLLITAMPGPGSSCNFSKSTLIDAISGGHGSIPTTVVAAPQFGDALRSLVSVNRSAGPGCDAAGTGTPRLRLFVSAV
jgi:hypothetical protein